MIDQEIQFYRDKLKDFIGQGERRGFIEEVLIWLIKKCDDYYIKLEGQVNGWE